MNNEGRQKRRRREGRDRKGERRGKRVRKEVDSKVVEIHRGGNGGDGEEAGGLPIADEIRSLSASRSHDRPGPVGPSLSISRSRGSRLDVGIAKHCRVMSVITPTAAGRPRGPYVERPSWHEIAGPTKATDRRTLPTGWLNTVLHEDRVPHRP